MSGKQLVTPCIQIALDAIDEREALRLCELLPRDPRIIIEAGAPLIKHCGIGVVRRIKQASGNAFVVADLKTMAAGALEAQLAAHGGADAAICAGAAGPKVIDEFISEAKKFGVISFLDTVNVADPLALLKSLKHLPAGVSLQCESELTQASLTHSWGEIKKIKAAFPSLSIAVAGGVSPETARKAAKAGADAVVVGRFITKASDPSQAAKKVLDAILSP